MVQRFGRANRYAELEEGADVRWIDLLAEIEDDRTAEALSLPYSVEDLKTARGRLLSLTDVAPVDLPAPEDIDPPRRVIRRKDLDDLFDTDPDLTGLRRRCLTLCPRTPTIPMSASSGATFQSPATTRCAQARRSCAPYRSEPPAIGSRRCASKEASRLFVRDSQWRRGDERPGVPAGWMRLTQSLWPGLTLLADVKTGGYSEASGFTGNPKDVPGPVTGADGSPAETTKSSPFDDGGESEGHDEDPRSEIGVPVLLSAHLEHVEAEAKALCDALDMDDDTCAAVARAARWHDVGKAHDIFQSHDAAGTRRL